MRTFRETLFAAVFAAACCCGTAGAAVIQFSFTGQVTDMSDPPDFFGGAVVAGATTVQGSFTFDTAGAVDGMPGDPTKANYPQVVTAASIDFGSGFLFNQFQAATQTPDGLETNDIQILDDPALDGWFMYGALVPPSGYIFAEVGISLTDSTATAFADDSIPTAAPVLADFDGRFFEFHLYVADTSVPGQSGVRLVDVYGVIDSLNEVPEPPALALFGMLGALLLTRSRRPAAR